MASIASFGAQHLRDQVLYHLDCEDPSTASFLAGRLHALEPRNPDASHLLSLTYYRLRRFKAAHDFAEKYGANGRHLGCAYVYALSCLELDKHKDGVLALERCKAQWTGQSNSDQRDGHSRRHLPDASAVWTLKGRLWQKYGHAKQAADCFVHAHKGNLFAWDAFEGLCKVGANLEVDRMFRPNSEMLGGSAAASSSNRAGSAQDIYQDAVQPLAQQMNFGGGHAVTPSSDPFGSSHNGLNGAPFVLPKVKGKSSIGNMSKSSVSDWNTPTAIGGIYDEDVAMGGVLLDDDSTGAQPPPAPERRPRLGDTADPVARSRPPAPRGYAQSGAGLGHEQELLPSVSQRHMAGGQKRTVSGVPAQASSDAQADPALQPTRRSNRIGTQTTTSTRLTRPPGEPAISAPRPGDRVSRPARPATGARGRTGAQMGRVVSGNRKVMPPDPAEKEKDNMPRAKSRASEKSVVPPAVANITADSRTQRPPSADSQNTQPDLQAQKAQQHRLALDELCTGLRKLATGHYALQQFDLPLAVSTFKSLPSAQRETPWVLAHLGKAYYEQGSYGEAETCFAKLLRLQPSRIEDMEVYSTVLWHLKKETALAMLCHSLRETHFDAVETWCCMGNAFSLSREHEKAIDAFKRAVHLDPEFSYAWTLMGHEFIANEEFEVALSCFRTAVAKDSRGYGGWYGLGKSYERMGKLEEAEQHYRVAASLNPSNSTLLVCIGVVLERLRNRKAALVQYTRALELSPLSALARFKKARVLMHLRLFDQALLELEILRDQAPDEANVWFLLGKCYKGLGERGPALKALTTALNLDVKAAPFIKEAIETLDEEDEESDED